MKPMGRMTPGVLPTTIFLFACVTSTDMPRMNPYLKDTKPLVFAHRGDSSYAPANTMPAFASAVTKGADVFETDVHWTKDGVLVVCHDDTVDAVTEGTGAVRDLTLDELRQLDFGYWFSPDGQTYPWRGRGVQIPTLQELLLAFPRMRVNIDIKPKHPLSLRQFLQEVNDCGAQQRVMAASFHHRVMQRVRRMSADMATSASLMDTALFVLGTWVGWPASRTMPYQALQVPPRQYGISVVNERTVARAHRAGLKVHVWTIDDPVDMERLLRLGVDGIVSNDPGTAVAVRDKFTMERSD